MTDLGGDCKVRSRPRITITLAPDLLQRVDRMVDEANIRNRSHAIEVLLRRSLDPEITRAAMLAGGPSEGDRPPALAPIGGRCLIEVMIDHLAQHGIDTLYVLAGDNEELLRGRLSGAETDGVRIRFISEGSPRGTAGAVKPLQHEIEDQPLLVLHGDVLTDIDLTEFIRFHRQEGTLATIAVKPRAAERRYGKVMLQGNRITEFLDTGNSEGLSIINAGVYLLEPEVLEMIADGAPAYFEVDLFPRLAAIGELTAFMFQGVWFDISAEASYREAQRRWAERTP